VRKLGKALGYIDEFVFLLIGLAGLALTVVVAVGGATAVQVGLVLVMTLAFLAYWAWTSNVWDWVRRRPENEPPPDPPE
jgi:hypothetical protein